MRSASGSRAPGAVGTSPRSVASARRAINGSSWSCWERAAWSPATIKATAPPITTKMTIAQTRMTILHLNIRDAHHDEVAHANQKRDQDGSSNRAKRPSIHEGHQILWVEEPQNHRQKYRDERKDGARGAHLGGDRADITFDPDAFTDGE